VTERERDAVLASVQAGRSGDLDEAAAAWLERLSPARRAVLVARHRILSAHPRADILAALDALPADVPPELALEVHLMRGNLCRELGDLGAAHAAERLAWIAMGWPTPPSPVGRAPWGIAAGVAAAGVVVIDDFRGPDECARIRAECDHLRGQGRLHPGGFYQADHGGRCDKLRAEVEELIDRHGASIPATAALTTALRRLVLGNNHFEQTTLYPMEFQIAAFPGDGASYGLHTDATPGPQIRRELTILYYPNPAWAAGDGGLLRVETAAGWIELEPIADRLVMFASEAVHEVTACRTDRYSITCWCWAPTPGSRA